MRAVTPAPFPASNTMTRWRYGSDKPICATRWSSPMYRRCSPLEFPRVQAHRRRGGVVRAIPAPDSASRPRSSFQTRWMLGEIRDGRRGSLHHAGRKQSGARRRGPIANNLTADELAEIARLAGVGAVMSFSSPRGEGRRKGLPARRACGSGKSWSDRRGRFRFCWVVDYPMYERSERPAR